MWSKSRKKQLLLAATCLGYRRVPQKNFSSFSARRADQNSHTATCHLVKVTPVTGMTTWNKTWRGCHWHTKMLKPFRNAQRTFHSRLKEKWLISLRVEIESLVSLPYHAAWRGSYNNSFKMVFSYTNHISSPWIMLRGGKLLGRYRSHKHIDCQQLYNSCDLCAREQFNTLAQKVLCAVYIHCIWCCEKRAFLFLSHLKD